MEMDKLYVQPRQDTEPDRQPPQKNRMGRVVEVKQYHQYLRRVDGSGHITMRNRKFLRKFTPVIALSNVNIA